MQSQVRPRNVSECADARSSEVAVAHYGTVLTVLASINLDHVNYFQAKIELKLSGSWWKSPGGVWMIAVFGYMYAPTAYAQPMSHKLRAP